MCEIYALFKIFKDQVDLLIQTQTCNLRIVSSYDTRVGNEKTR